MKDDLVKEPKTLKKRSSSIRQFFGHAKQGNVDIEVGETSAPSFGAIEPMPVVVAQTPAQSDALVAQRA